MSTVHRVEVLAAWLTAMVLLCTVYGRAMRRMGK